MRGLWLIGMMLFFVTRVWAQDVPVPPGFVLQPLDPTDGQIARPHGWYYTSGSTPSGWMWTISREDPAKGPYKTGMRIQMLMGVEAGSGFSKPGFVEHFIEQKRRESLQVVRDCTTEAAGDFHRRCFETVEVLGTEGAQQEFHVLYTLQWSTTMDMVVVTIFGAPVEEWPKLRGTVDTMSVMRLIGPDFGRGSGEQKASASVKKQPAHATGFDTVYNHVPPGANAADDAPIKALYGDTYRFVDITPRPAFKRAEATAGGYPSRCLCAGWDERIGEGGVGLHHFPRRPSRGAAFPGDQR